MISIQWMGISNLTIGILFTLTSVPAYPIEEIFPPDYVYISNATNVNKRYSTPEAANLDSCNLLNGTMYDPTLKSASLPWLCFSEYMWVASCNPDPRPGFLSLTQLVACEVPECSGLYGAPPDNPKIYPDGTRYWRSSLDNMCHKIGPDNLTITLSGDTNSTEPWHKKRDPDHLKANLPYKAIVKDQNGQPKTNFGVTITTDVNPDSGGHIHTNARPKGKLVDRVGTAVKTKDGKVSIPGKTDGSGVFEFTFGAEEASGTHTLTAKCDSGCQAPASTTVNVKVDGLEQIPSGASFYTLIDTDGTVIGATSDKHKANHYLTSEAATILLNMASSYHAEIKYWTKPSNGKKSVPPLPLYLNDASLAWGGVFDINGDWKVDHIEHRRGAVIDIRANSKPGSIPSGNFEKFIKLAKYYGAHAKIHSPVSDNQHFHARLLNREE